MKRKKILLVILLSIMCLPYMVSAKTEISDGTALKAALNTGGDLILVNDVEITTNTAINSETILDLNGHTVNMGSKTLIPYKNLTIKDTSSDKTGKVVSTGQFTFQVGTKDNPGELTLDSGTIEANGSYGINNYGTLTVNDGTIIGNDFVIYNQGTFTMNNGSITARTGLGVRNNLNATFTMNGGLLKIISDSDAVILGQNGAKFTMNGGKIEAICDTGYFGGGISAFKNTEVRINGGEISSYTHALAGNGSTSGNNEGTNAKFTITGGTIKAVVGCAIYAPQVNGETVITGGNLISESSAIEIRAGSLSISGGTFTGNKNEYYISPSERGSRTIGAAVAVTQHTTKQPIDVHICGGVFNAYLPLVKNNPLENESEIISLAKMAIDEPCGKLEFITTGEKTVEGYDLTGFIKGGLYTPNVDQDYVAEGYQKWDKNSNEKEVSKIHVIEVDEKSTNYVIDIDPSSPTNKEVTIKVKDRDKYKTVIEVRDKEGNLIPVTNNKFIMPNSDVTIKVRYVRNLIPDNLINPTTGTNYISVIVIIAFVSYTIYYKRKERKKRI